MDQKYVAELLLTRDRLSYEQLCERLGESDAIEQRELKDSLTLIDGAYVHRRDTEKQLQQWIHSGPIACNVQDEAGSGKTTLLAHMIETWNKQGHAALFLRGRYQENLEFHTVLKQRLRIDNDIDIEDLCEVLESNNDSLLLWMQSTKTEPPRNC